MHKALFWIGAVIFVAYIVANSDYTNPQIVNDSCAGGASEAEVRKMWVTVKATQPPGTDVDRVTADLLRQAENLCREFRDRKPTPLPPELQKMVR